MIGAPERTVTLVDSSYVRRSYQERRVGLVCRRAAPKGGRILDVGWRAGSGGHSR